MANPTKNQPAAPTQPLEPHQPLPPAQPLNNPPAVLAGQQQLTPGAAAFQAAAGERKEAPVKLPLIKILHKTAEFQLPNGELVQEIAGYPVYHFLTRRYYEKAFRMGEKGQPPDCYSVDMIEPHPGSKNKQCDTCAACKMAQFGTGRDGRVPACSTFTWTFLLNPQFGPTPIGVLIAPPSSLRALVGSMFAPGYFAQAQARNGNYELTWTRFRLRPVGEGGEVAYSVLEPAMGPVQQDPEKCKQIGLIYKQFKKLMDEFRSGVTDLPSDEEDDE
jgi:hypothetical protein